MHRHNVINTTYNHIKLDDKLLEEIRCQVISAPTLIEIEPSLIDEVTTWLSQD